MQKNYFAPGNIDKYFVQVMDNGNLILPPFRASDYKQEVHAQVSLLLFIVVVIVVLLTIPTILRRTVVLRRTSWERFSLGMFTSEQVHSTLSSCNAHNRHGQYWTWTQLDVDNTGHYRTILDMNISGQDMIEHEMIGHWDRN